jgi:hypothetical protein
MPHIIKIEINAPCGSGKFELPFCKYYENEETTQGDDDYLWEWCTHPDCVDDEHGHLTKCPRIK